MRSRACVAPSRLGISSVTRPLVSADSFPCSRKVAHGWTISVLRDVLAVRCTMSKERTGRNFRQWCICALHCTSLIERLFLGALHPSVELQSAPKKNGLSSFTSDVTIHTHCWNFFAFASHFKILFLKARAGNVFVRRCSQLMCAGRSKGERKGRLGREKI